MGLSYQHRPSLLGGTSIDAWDLMWDRWRRKVSNQPELGQWRHLHRQQCRLQQQSADLPLHLWTGGCAMFARMVEQSECSRTLLSFLHPSGPLNWNAKLWHPRYWASLSNGKIQHWLWVHMAQMLIVVFKGFTKFAQPNELSRILLQMACCFPLTFTSKENQYFSWCFKSHLMSSWADAQEEHSWFFKSSSISSWSSCHHVCSSLTPYLFQFKLLKNLNQLP